MAAPTSPADLSATVASNGPDGATEQVSVLDDYIRGLSGAVKQLVNKGADIPSAATITPAATASFFDISGTTGITAIGSTNSWDGRIVWFQFDGALTITHASTLKLPGAVNYTTAAGDVLAFVQETSGTWRCVGMTRAVTWPYFYCNGSATKTVTGDYTTYTEVVDSGSNFASGVFTAPIAGLYQFNLNYYLTTSVTGENVRGKIDRNGSAIANFGGIIDSSVAEEGGVSVSYYLSAGDTIKVVVNSLTSANSGLLVTEFSGHLVR